MVKPKAVRGIKKGTQEDFRENQQRALAYSEDDERRYFFAVAGLVISNQIPSCEANE